MENNSNPTIEQTTGARPTFLTVLCILSFIAAGFAIIAYVLVITAIGAISAVASNVESMSGESGQMAAQVSDALSKTPSVGLTWAYVAIGFVTTLVGLFGVIKMWKMQKIGFFLYTGANIVSIIMTIVYSGFGVGIIISALFIVLYGLNLKHLK